jgi:hypothetical protein
MFEENIWTEEDKIIRSWRKMHNEELYNLYSSSAIITMIKSTRIRLAEDAAHMEML